MGERLELLKVEVALGPPPACAHRDGWPLSVNGRFHLSEIARQGLSVPHLMRIHLVGPEAGGALHMEVDEPSGATKVGVCWSSPAPQCEATVDLDLLTSSSLGGPAGETDYVLVVGRYTVRVVYAGGSRKRLVFMTGSY